MFKDAYGFIFVLLLSGLIASAVVWYSSDTPHKSVLVTCIGYGLPKIEAIIKDVRTESWGFTGVDENGDRQFFMKDSAYTCWSSSVNTSKQRQP